MRLATPIVLLLLPLALFLAFFNPATLDVGNSGWLIDGSDGGENALGSHAYWLDRQAGASLKTTLLNAPEGVPMLFTDSNPLVTLAAKPFATLLPADAQLIGPFILLSFFLQVMFAWLLLRPHAPGPLALWAGVALLAFPPTLFNRFVHANLMAHWTILAALSLFLDDKRNSRFRWWAPLITVSALIHSYLLIMVGAIWASAMMACLANGARRTRLEIVAHSVAVLALVAGLAWWLGVSGHVPAGNFGAFSMPIDALWNPGIGTFSNLLPAHEESPGRGFEGFQYLGAGGLLLVAAATIIAGYRPAREGECVTRRRLRMLAPALLVLAILAIARLPLPTGIAALLDPVRASGRLFWPVGYTLILVAILTVFRLPADRAGLALTAAVALQVVDLAGMADAVRAQSQDAAQHQLYARTLDPRWGRLVGKSQSIAFMPSDVTKDLALFQEIAWRAAKAGKPITNVYAARSSRITMRRLAIEGAAFAQGDLVPGRLYILLGATPVPAGVGHWLKLDGVTVIAAF